MNLTLKYRLYPTVAQRHAMERTLEACRWVYNQTLEVRQEAWMERGETLTRYDTINLLPEWKVEQPWLHEAYSQVLQEVCGRVDLALAAFFRRVQAGEAPGYPRFKGQGWYKSFTFPQAGSGWKLLDNGRVRLSKIGEVKLKLHRPLLGTVKRLTIKRDRLGNWYACFVIEVELEALPSVAEVVGIDLGLHRFATLTTGDPVANPRFFRQDERELAKAQRKLSACERGSPAYRKQQRVVQHIHQRIANRRQNFAHQLSRALVNSFQIIVFEELQPSNMVKLHTLAKSINDAAWSQLVQYTTYKAANAGRTLVLVDPRYSSQDCSGCGMRVPKELSTRLHRCPHCGLELDRDLNAAFNILARGLACIGSNP